MGSKRKRRGRRRRTWWMRRRWRRRRRRGLNISTTLLTLSFPFTNCVKHNQVS